jgi:hypothetical protein
MATYKVIGKSEDGKYFDSQAREDVIAYCLQGKKTPHSYIGSRAVNIEQAAMEMETLAQLYNNDTKVRLRHSIISFDTSENITYAQAAEIADAAIRYFGDEYQILYSIHEDTDHVHAHIVMNQVSYIDGHKYYGTKAQHHGFIDYMRKVVRPYGISSFIPVSDNTEPPSTSL